MTKKARIEKAAKAIYGIMAFDESDMPEWDKAEEKERETALELGEHAVNLWDALNPGQPEE